MISTALGRDLIESLYRIDPDIVEPELRFKI